MRFAALTLILAECLDPTPDPDVPFGEQQYGEACDAEALCDLGLVCAGDDTCRFPGEPGTAQAGQPCVSSAYCAQGLVCDALGECAAPGDPGTAAAGETCLDEADCQLGLRCLDGTCAGFSLPLWLGAECSDPAQDGIFRVLFEVPGATPLAEFYRLPFPNDLRRREGGLDLSGHPTPGELIPLIGDPVGALLDLLADAPAFGNNQAVLLRFSQSPEFSSLEAGLPADGGTIGVIDLTEGPDFGTLHPAGWGATTGRGAYICHNRLGFSPLDGRPWVPGHTYGVFVTTGVTDRSGSAVAADADFAALMSATPPSDPVLLAGWETYAPLRGWASDNGVTLAGGAVFTVGDPVEPARLLRQAVHAAEAPTASGLHHCTAEGGPYADAGDPGRGCRGQEAPFEEIQGTVALPRFQQGTPPYKTVADGGGIDFSAGAPAPVGTTDVVFSLTVPDGVMPEAGWPLVIYAHGTGGGYQSAVRDDTAALLASVTLDDGTTVRLATLGFDAVLHGARRGQENWDPAWLAVDPGAYDPDVLYFNPLNPTATRDNGLQAAADVFALVRFARSLDWDAATSPTGARVRIDPERVYYLGHSQGAVSGIAPLALEPDVSASVLSGGGGLLIESLLNKKLPNDLAAAIAVGLADPTLDRYHPVLNLAQAFAEASDGVNHAGHLLADPLGDDPPRSVFQVYGVGDNYTPDETQIALARALRVAQMPGASTPLQGITTVTPPVRANRAAGRATGVVGLYERPGANDAHFVLFDRDDTRRQVAHFFGTAVRDGVPTVVAPAP